MKSRKIMIIVASIVALLSIGGCTVKHKDDTKQGKTIAASSTKDLKEDEETIKKKQLDYLKEHEQKVIDLVKAQNSKVESVQIEESGWRVDIPINDDNTLNLDEMYLGSDIGIGGRLFE